MKKTISLPIDSAVAVTNELIRRLLNDRISQVLWKDKTLDLVNITWDDIEEATAFSEAIEEAVIALLPRVRGATGLYDPKELYEEVLAQRIKSSKKKAKPKKAKLI